VFKRSFNVTPKTTGAPYKVKAKLPKTKTEAPTAVVTRLRSVSPADNRCHFVLLDKDESCHTAVFGPAYLTGELLNQG